MQLLIYTIIAILLFKTGRFLLNQLSQRFERFPYQQNKQNKQFKDFLIWIFIYSFITTNGFSRFEPNINPISNLLADIPYRIVSFTPFKAISDAITLNDFYDYVYGAREFGNLDLTYQISLYSALLIISPPEQHLYALEHHWFAA